MLLSIDDLTRFKAEVKDASFPIKDIFFSLSDRSLSYLVIDTGSWFETDTVLVSSALISSVSTDDRVIRLDTDEGSIRSAPVWQEGQSSLLDAMPPVIVGPFGNTIAPAMLAAIARREQGDTARGQALTRDLESFSSMARTEAFGTDGEIGRAIDFLVSPETRDITHVIIDNGKVVAGRQLVVPIEKLRYQADQETHLVLDIASDELADAPQMENADRVDRNWFDALRTYYQLPV